MTIKGRKLYSYKLEDKLCTWSNPFNAMIWNMHFVYTTKFKPMLQCSAMPCINNFLKYLPNLTIFIIFPRIITQILLTKNNVTYKISTGATVRYTRPVQHAGVLQADIKICMYFQFKRKAIHK